ncbi:MAG: hypothetical protein PHQ91_12290 [Thermoanaerobaculaceae bacterium]|nr:hypothetical protein [Thermoanaerobaculaceae bacterium]
MARPWQSFAGPSSPPARYAAITLPPATATAPRRSTASGTPAARVTTLAQKCMPYVK